MCRMKAKYWILGSSAFLLAASACAQMKCKMPNGVTITKQLGECPHDAVAAFTLDGKLLPKPSETPEGQARVAQAQEAKQKREERQKAKENAVVDANLKKMDDELAELKKKRDADAQQRKERVYAQACDVLGLPKHRCKTEYSWRHGSLIIVSTHLLPSNIDAICQNYANTVRRNLLDSRLGNGWTIRINFSPTDKVIAECSI